MNPPYVPEDAQEYDSPSKNKPKRPAPLGLSHTAVVLTLALGSISTSKVVAIADDGPPQVQTIDFEPVDATRDREVPVRVYLSPHPSPQPIILYSHGLGGSRQNKAYLGEHWSAAGFICVFMQHAGSDREVIRPAKPLQRFKALKAAVSVKSSLDRIGDVSFVIDQLERWNKLAGHKLFGQLDLHRIGMSGHSYGASTTLAVAGRNFPFRKRYLEPRIVAFLAMSPQPGKGMSVERAFRSIDLPMLCMTGTKDDSPIDASVTPEARRSVYRAMPSGDKFQLVLEGAHHFSFGDARNQKARRQDPRHHPTILHLSTKFWHAYLSRDVEAKRWLQSNKPPTEGVLSPKDLWEWK